MKHKLFTTLLVMLMSMVGMHAYAYEFSAANEDGVTIDYKLINEDTELEVVGCEYGTTVLQIPTEVHYNVGNKDLPVTSIGDNAFHWNSYLVKVVLPNSIITIGENAFQGCGNLESINIPSSVKTIKAEALYSGNDDTKLIIEDIASWCEIDFVDVNTRPGRIYSDEDTEIVNLVIPSTVTSIGAYCFNGCKNLLSVDIPTSVTNIGEGAFCFCEGLSSVTIPSSVETIGEQAFTYCKNLSTLNLSTGLRSIGGSAFSSCNSLKNVILPNSVENIGDYAFYCCDIESINIPSNVSHIGHNPFCGNEKLVSITVSPYNSHYDSRNNCNCIIESNTDKLVSITKDYKVPDFIKIIGRGAFASPNYPNENRVDVNLISLPEGLVEIEDWGIGWLHIGRLNIPSTIKNLRRRCMNNIYIDSLNIADLKAWCEAVEYWPVCDGRSYLFQDGKRITNLVIPSGTTRIGQDAFTNIYGVSSVFIPNSVTAIESRAFGIGDLSEVTVEHEAPPALTNDICYNASNVTLYVPRGSKAAYEAADYWKDFKEIKEYGDGNATITMGSSGIATYSNNSDLDFTGVSGLKAYIASGFNPATGNLTMTRVYEVPAGEGLILKGAANSYEVPYEETSAYYANLLVGVPTTTTVNPTEGSYTNFILANDELKGIGFYPLASAGEIGPNKAYLQLPTSILPAASRSLRMVFEDEEEEVTGINSLNEKGAMSNEKFFDLQGRRVEKPTRGLYIKDGKKIMVK